MGQSIMFIGAICVFLGVLDIFEFSTDSAGTINWKNTATKIVLGSFVVGIGALMKYFE